MACWRTIGLGDDIFLCFLPLSHAYEHTAGPVLSRFPVGAQIYYAESIEQLLTNLAEVRPTIMTAVPRLYESMHQRIVRGVEKQGKPEAEVCSNLAVRLGTKAYEDPGSLSAVDQRSSERPGRTAGAVEKVRLPIRRPPEGHGLRRRGA